VSPLSSMRASCVRDLTPSFVNTRRRCASIVRRAAL
jgi:hypothetical protein